jgi:hypothetical protein
VFFAPGAKHTQGEQAEKGSPPAEILAIFTVEGAGVAGGRPTDRYTRTSRCLKL